MNVINSVNRDAGQKNEKERGKAGLAILLWMLGVPGSIVLLYLVFAR